MYKKQDYESLNRINQFKHLLKVALLTFLICLLVLAPALWFWDASVKMRTALRNAKNVLRNTELLAIVYDGTGASFLDSSRASGLSEEAEAEIKDYAGVEDGTIRLASWDAANEEVLSMTYREGIYVLTYERDIDEDAGVWEIYRRVRVYESDQ